MQRAFVQTADLSRQQKPRLLLACRNGSRWVAESACGTFGQLN
jgi:hypothetical protein